MNFKDKRRTPIKTFIWLLVLLVGFLVVLFRFQIGDLLLKNYGRCATANLTTELQSVKYVKPTYVYSFYVAGKEHKANSRIEEKTASIPQQLCIVYIPFLPSVNRPLSYFQSLDVECACK